MVQRQFKDREMVENAFSVQSSEKQIFGERIKVMASKRNPTMAQVAYRFYIKFKKVKLSVEILDLRVKFWALCTRKFNLTKSRFIR